MCFVYGFICFVIFFFLSSCVWVLFCYVLLSLSLSPSLSLSVCVCVCVCVFYFGFFFLFFSGFFRGSVCIYVLNRFLQTCMNIISHDNVFHSLSVVS